MVKLVPLSRAVRVKKGDYLRKVGSGIRLMPALMHGWAVISPKIINTEVYICDMIKGNESDVGNIDFELQAKKGDKFLCFTLFLKLKNCSYLCNQMFD